MSFGHASTDAAVVARLVARQFPQWAGRPVTAIPSAGAGNALFRLGDDLVVRLPRHPGTVAAIDIALTWLPRLAGQLPLAIPVPVAAGSPDDLFPRPWAIFQWLRGVSLAGHPNVDPTDLAIRLGRFVAALQSADNHDAPATMRPNPLDGDGSDVRRDIRLLCAEGAVDEALASALWESAAAVPTCQAPRWIHGDLLPMNLLTDRGSLSAVIDFDLMGIGDPAIDMLPAWTLPSAKVRQLFRESAGVDDNTWMRGRGYALAAGLGSMPRSALPGTDPRMRF